MPYLFAVSLLWAFSFGLIKGRLVGLDAAFISAVRLTLALVVFLPFLRLGGLARRTVFAFTAIGAVQFGLMYLAYNESFRFLRAYEVALFTIHHSDFRDAARRRI
jgi:drug/metabolite transporter (DMT)-like permease